MRFLDIVYSASFRQHLPNLAHSLHDIKAFRVFVHYFHGTTKGVMTDYLLKYYHHFDVYEVNTDGGIEVYLEKGKARDLVELAGETAGQFLSDVETILTPFPFVRIKSFPRDIHAIISSAKEDNDICKYVMEHLFVTYLLSSKALTKCLAPLLCQKMLNVFLEEILGVRVEEKEEEIYLNIM